MSGKCAVNCNDRYQNGAKKGFEQFYDEKAVRKRALISQGHRRRLAKKRNAD
jgi:hypothetical protein